MSVRHNRQTVCNSVDNILLLFQAMCGSNTVGAIVCKLDLHKKMVRRGYIAMLAVDRNYRRRGIGEQTIFVDLILRK